MMMPIKVLCFFFFLLFSGNAKLATLFMFGNCASKKLRITKIIVSQPTDARVSFIEYSFEVTFHL